MTIYHNGRLMSFSSVLRLGIKYRSFSTYTTALATTTEPTYANLKAESLQSDENQVFLNEDIMVSNVVTVLNL